MTLLHCLAFKRIAQNYTVVLSNSSVVHLL